MIYPPVNDQTVSSSEGDRDREVTFVLDTSGSMAGDAIKQAKQALAFAIDDLASSDKFNIIQFNSSAEQLWHKAQYADQQNKMEAFGFISDLEASGGTEMYSALSIALKAENSNKGFFKQVLFITDGSVSNEHALMQLIGKELGHQRLFTIGIGAAPNSYFMTEAALVGKGSFTFIADTSQVNDKMRELLEKIKSPALTDIQLNLKSLGPTDKFEMYPNKIGDLYKHEPLAFSYKKTKGDSGQLTSQPSNSAPMLVGNYQGEQWQFTPTAFDESVDHKANSEHKVKGKRARGVNVLWAREKIAQLTRDKRMLTKSPLNNDVEAEKMIEVMTSTALEHHIVSAYTSLIAVDIVPTVKPNEKDPIKNTNKVANTNSNKQGMLPQTATRADLTIIIGIVLLLIAFALRYQLAKKRGQRALEVACCYGIAE
jgi:Ca-activated chloride channel family protein